MILIIFIACFSIISLLVFHEFGHFIIAKKFGVKVEEFGIGYPPKIWGKKIGDTIYSLNLIPFGAFVRIADGEGGGIITEKNKDYKNLSIWKRAAILLGGAFSFWIVSIVLLSIVFSSGVSQVISDDEIGNLINPAVQVTSIALDSPAEKAGLMIGDIIIQIKIQDSEEGNKIDKIVDIQKLSEISAGKEMKVTVKRINEQLDIFLTPRITPPSGEGPLGISLVRTAEKSYPWWQVPIKGIETTFFLTKAVVLGLADLILGLVKGNGLPKGFQVMGPVGIGSLVTQAAQVGVIYFLQFISIISVNMAVLNILPVPALDGGKLLFLLIEKIKRAPIKQNTEERITVVFFVALLLIMVFVTIKDIIKLF